MTVTGQPSAGTPYLVTFGGDYAGQSIPNLAAVGTDLTGASPSITVQTSTAGSLQPPTYIQAIPNSTPAIDGNNAEQRIIITSTLNSAAANAPGFVLESSHSELRGLIVTGFTVGVDVAQGTNPTAPVGDLIQGNSIGDYFVYPVDPSTGEPEPAPDTDYLQIGRPRQPLYPMIPPANSAQGIVLQSTYSTVGGNNPQEDNLICGNGAEGIWVQPGSSGNQILGNQIGTAGPSINGYYSYDGNGAQGVYIQSTAAAPSTSNYVGAAAAGNLISSNTNSGVEIDGVGNRNLVQGNYIGVGPNGGYKFGTGDPGNGGDGVLIEDGSQNEIGGSSSEMGNTIASNHGSGIYITNVTGSATGNVAAYNMIGVTADGSQILGNWSDGVSLYSPSNTIGPGNVISQNLRGISIYGPGTAPLADGTNILVVDNLIGTDATGEGRLRQRLRRHTNRQLIE